MAYDVMIIIGLGRRRCGRGGAVFVIGAVALGSPSLRMVVVIGARPMEFLLCVGLQSSRVELNIKVCFDRVLIDLIYKLFTSVCIG